jgi:hypothetical protein
MSRFALLEHDTRTAGGVPPAERGVHWDLLVEIPGQALVPTWRLAADPLTTPGPIPALRIKDHRRLYLEYEGPVSGDRGWLRRVDAGAGDSAIVTGNTLTVRLTGQRLHGWFEIAQQPDGQTVFRRREERASAERPAARPRREDASGI